MAFVKGKIETLPAVASTGNVVGKGSTNIKSESQHTDVKLEHAGQDGQSFKTVNEDSAPSIADGRFTTPVMKRERSQSSPDTPLSDITDVSDKFYYLDLDRLQVQSPPRKKRSTIGLRSRTVNNEKPDLSGTDNEDGPHEVEEVGKDSSTEAEESVSHESLSPSQRRAGRGGRGRGKGRGKGKGTRKG